MAKRSGVMLCIPFEERRLTEPKFGWQFPIIVQPKLDGERCRVVQKNGKIVLLSSECNEIISVPHINKYLQDHFRDVTPELDGELYLHGWDFSDIHSVVSRRENIHEKSELMQLHIFDYVSPTAQISRSTSLTYYKWLDKGPVKLVNSVIANNMKELMEAYDRFLDLGYEGIIIRNIRAPYVRKRSRFLMKFKPKKDDYYKILQVIEAFREDGIPLGMVGAFRCCGSDGTSFKVGAGTLTHDRRRELWKDWHMLLGKFCHVSYQNITTGGVPRFGICLDITDKNPEEFTYGGIL